MIQVAVIDDGINEKFYDIGLLDFNIEIGHESEIYSRSGYDTMLPGHGTTCAAIIKKYAPEVHLGSIKILNDSNKRAAKYQFTAALEWCAENGIKLVHLSIGTIDFRDFEKIGDCVDRATAKGLIIVAACNNKNVYTVPSCLSNVIGVRCRLIYTDTQYRFIPYSFDGIDVEASGRHLLKDAFGRDRYTDPANSFAAPLITAMTYNILQKKPASTLEDIKMKLYQNALNFEDNGYDPYLSMTPELYKMHLQEKMTVINQVDIDIPVIAVFDGSSDVFDRLNMLFYKEGYYSVKISTNYADISNGNEYLPEGIQMTKFIALVYKKYCCDIILVRISKDMAFEGIVNNCKFDIILDGYDDKGFNGAVLSIGEDRNDGHIEDIFLKMLELLT